MAGRLVACPDAVGGRLKHTSPAACLSCDLLRFVRDTTPDEAALIAWLGGEEGRFHVLRKAGLLVVKDGHVQLSASHLNADSTTFTFGIQVFHIDQDRVDTVRR